MEEIVKNERSSVHLDNFFDVNFNLGSFLLTPAALLPRSMLCLSASLHLGTVRTPRQMIRSFFYSEIMCGSGRRGGRGGRVHGQGSHHPSTSPNGLTAGGTKLMSFAAKMDIFLADV